MEGRETVDDLIAASKMLQGFKEKSLKKTVSDLEKKFVGTGKDDSASVLSSCAVTTDLLRAALLVKHASSQIDEIMHTLGILLCLPKMLLDDEVVESLSLAAGNTGRVFDLKTTHRVAEFTFIEWKGGSEVIRQNKVFKDFFFLAEEDTPKRRELYVVGTDMPLKFLKSRRAIDRILAGNAKLGGSFRSRHGDRFKVVCDYYLANKDKVEVKDVRELLPSGLFGERNGAPCG